QEQQFEATLQELLRQPSAKESLGAALAPDVQGPFARRGTRSPSAREGMVTTSAGEQVPIRSKRITPEFMEWYNARTPPTASAAKNRRVIIAGGGATGALTAIHAYNHFANLDITLVEMREEFSLPIRWGQPQECADILTFIDPVLAKRVLAKAWPLFGG